MRRDAVRLITRLLRNSDATSAIEFAIVAPVFFVLVFGIAIYGAYFASLSLVNHIAYEAARATIAGLSDDERASLAEVRADELISSFSGFLNPEAITVSSGAQQDGLYAVTVQYRFNDLGLSSLSLLPMPPTSETATYTVSHGGY
jgi:Flp pilus assembly protein TadG